MAVERESDAKPANEEGSVRANIDSFARLMKDIAATGEEGQSFARDIMNHIAYTVEQSLSHEDREIVERIRRKREMMNA